jgi:hypothetical protein
MSASRARRVVRDAQKAIAFRIAFTTFFTHLATDGTWTTTATSAPAPTTSPSAAAFKEVNQGPHPSRNTIPAVTI